MSDSDVTMLPCTKDVQPDHRMPESHVTLPPCPEGVQPSAIPDEVADSCPLTVEPYQPKKYKRQTGTINSGTEYEKKFAMLLPLRCISSKVEDMWMATNINKGRDFDDIVLTVKNEGKVVSYMIQLKHSNRKSVTKNQFNSPEGNFSLKKYFSSIDKFQNSERIRDLANFSNVYFVLFTNMTVGDFDFLVKNNDEQMEIINTSNQIYTIDCTKLKNLEKEQCRNNFRFLPSQLNVIDLEWLIEDEVRRFCDGANIALVYPKIIVGNYVKFIGEWYDGNMGGHYYLTKEIVFQKQCELLLNQYEMNFNKKQFLFNNSLQNLTWKEIIGGKEITIVDYSKVTEDFLINYTVCELNRYFTGFYIDTWNKPMSREEENLFYEENADLRNEMRRRICKFGGLTAYDLYNCLAGLKKIPKLLVVSSSKDYQSILNILSFFGQRFKIILLIKGNTHCAAPTPQQQRVTINYWNAPVAQEHLFTSLEDLTEEHQGMILKSVIKFDETPAIPVGDVLPAEVFRFINCSDIIHILCNRSTNNLEDMICHCVPRTSQKIFLKSQALEELSNEIFILNIDPSPYLRCNAIDIRKVDWSDLKDRTIFIASPNKAMDFKKVFVRIRKPIHLISVTNYDKLRLELTFTYGSREGIKRFMYRSANKLFLDCRWIGLVNRSGRVVWYGSQDRKDRYTFQTKFGYRFEHVDEKGIRILNAGTCRK